MKSALIIVLLVCASPVAAQERADSIGPVMPAAIAGGIIGTGAGWGAGLLAVTATVNCGEGPNTSFCGYGEAIVGMALGGTVGAAVGAYAGARLAGGQSSRVAPTVGAVLGIATGAALLLAMGTFAIDPGDGAFLVFAVGQGGTAGWFAGRSARKRAEQR